MNKYSNIIVLVALILVFSYKSKADQDDEWTKYKLQFNKVYHQKSEEISRHLAWKSNTAFIKKHNLEADAGKKTYRVKMNQFGDMTREQMKSKMSLSSSLIKKRKNTSPIREKALATPKIPDSIDWRELGAVTPILAQGNCGSDWADAAITTMEGQHFRASGKLIPLSAQQLMDCSKSFGTQGCNGGITDQAYAYIIVNGLNSNATYPYTGNDGAQCLFKPDEVVARATGYKDLPAGDEAALTEAIAQIGPISIVVDAIHGFVLYNSGVFYEADCDPAEMDHAVTAVGYGKTDNGTEFYIVKNSWGWNWGENGYIRMSRNRNNNCGIANQGAYPIVSFNQASSLKRNSSIFSIIVLIFLAVVTINY